MFVKPADGIKIYCPTTRALLPPEGAERTEEVTYWTRAAMAGDVTIGAVLPVEPEEPEV